MAAAARVAVKSAGDAACTGTPAAAFEDVSRDEETGGAFGRPPVLLVGLAMVIPCE
jgi:hypothetical protein